ncbi:PREDICTED: long-chain fatty acid transport protein 6-like [Galeopterus variegatus]|uniref:Long-chain-fatty-acid--CoA ligase n=1 Tax=Galeopterus variegatus TaxID=482537 RepID=A0ABM0RHK6_GALVR|nr:PREDICTED: long-chain fatty acid transport protein 6-like [Galeopterus variegatus]
MLLSWLTGLGAGMVFLYFVQKLLFPYFWDDFWFLLKVVRFGIRMEMYRQRGELVTGLDKFLSHAKRQPQKPFIVYEGDIYTYQDVDKRSSRVANVFLNHSSLKKGDTVALLMSNEPDFVHVWFGLAKLGCVVAFLNTNIRSSSLLSCIHTCMPSAIVVGADLLGNIEELLPSLPKDISVWGMKDSVPQGVISLKEKLSTSSDEPVPRSYHVASSLKSTCLYIFTSGTTGMIQFFLRLKKNAIYLQSKVSGNFLPCVVTKHLRKHACKKVLKSYNFQTWMKKLIALTLTWQIIMFT